jgi:hypothetical protein
VVNTPLDWRQLCAIARTIVEAAPSIDDHEWSERIKDRVVAEFRPYPPPHEITAAIRAVSRALHRSSPSRSASASGLKVDRGA